MPSRLNRFLLAQLHMDSIATKPTRRSLENALKTLPKELDLTYEEAMKRIEDQDEDDRELAWKILSWIALASRPLKKTEIQHALAVEVGDNTFDDLNIPDDELLTSLCAGLVTVDVLDSTVRPIHYTTQEYFERVLRVRFCGLQSEITRICLTYLSFEPFAQEFPVTMVKDEYPFYLYAAENWYGDIKKNQTVRDECSKNLGVFLQKSACLLLAIEFLHRESSSASSDTEFVDGWTRLHVAASLGMNDMIQEFIQQSSALVDKTDTSGRTSLHVAISHNHPSTAIILLEHGARINAQSRLGRTPLHDALHTGNLSLSRLLIDWGAQVEIEDSNGATALHFAAWGGDADVIRLILAKLTNINVTTHENHTPLWYAVLGDRSAAVDLLVSCGADIDIAERDDRPCPSGARSGRTPLHKAAQIGNLRVVNAFLAYQPDLRQEDGDGYTALDYAVLEEHCQVAETLIEHGAVATPRMLYKAVQAGSTEMAKLISGYLKRMKHLDLNPLIPAIKRSDEELLNILIAMDTIATQLKTGDGHGKCPLHWAAGRGFVVGAKLLLAAGADPNQPDNYSQVPLHLAAEWNQTEIVEILLRAGADVNAVDLGGETPLHRAVAMNSAGAVSLLLSEPDISTSCLCPDENGTLLHVAAYQGATETLEVILTDQQFLEIIDEYNGQSQTALLCAAERGHADAVAVLINHGADPNIRDGGGYAALHVAASGGHAEMIVALVNNSSTDIDLRDNESRTALFLAAEGGHANAMEILLRHGADPNVRDANKQPILHFAAKQYLLRLPEVVSNSTGRRIQQAYSGCLKLLIQDVADPGATDANDETVLHIAAKSRITSLTEILLTSGRHMAVNACDGTGRTPLIWAAENDCYGVVGILLSYGAKTDATDHRRETALHRAAANGCVAISQKLVKYGAPMDVVDVDGETAYEKAEAAGWTMYEWGLSAFTDDPEYFTDAHICGICGHPELYTAYSMRGLGQRYAVWHNAGWS